MKKEKKSKTNVPRGSYFPVNKASRASTTGK
jgi:hypothetical protein